MKDKKKISITIPHQTHELLKRAAQIQGTEISQFVMYAAYEAAQDIVLKSDVIELSLADQKVFAEALINPPKPNAALQRAFIKHKKMIISE